MRARNMQALTDAIKRRHPGIVIYGIGDAAHMLRYSDHNEDDTPGSLAAQSDADSNPEHRAIDAMLGPAFTKAQAYALIADLLADPAALRRLRYIIFDGWIWSRTNGWRKVAFDGDPHRDHPHISGDAADDENASGWPAVETGDDMITKADVVTLLTTAAFPYAQPTQSLGTTWLSTFNDVKALRAESAADKARDEATLAAITALAAGGGNVETAPILAAIADARQQTLARTQVLLDRIAELEGELADRDARLAAALAPSEG